MNFYMLYAFFISSIAVFGGQIEGNADPPKYFWSRTDTRFDFVVGITVDNKPVGIGSRVYSHVIVTSANPIERYLTWKGPKSTDYADRNNKIKLYYVRDYWDKCSPFPVLSYSANLSKRNSSWIKMGFARDHSPIHDLVFIFLSDWAHSKKSLKPRVVSWTGLTFAGFGYVDKEHILNNTVLQIQIYRVKEEVNCDELIPRAWGRFICIRNVKNNYGIQSGAPLMGRDYVRGIGSFALTKGNESILVFTDFSFYDWILVKHYDRLIDTDPNWLRNRGLFRS